ncbi:carbamoyltransferase C-terminal domain-containing protein [Nocardia sp. NPDC047038]|uniref:carbamoyltransferase C-terminal domain-containing protein n=1 Tax=Nocardia sp. NPDC047038 TaxID=3154338 RepID=UPI0033F525CD
MMVRTIVSINFNHDGAAVVLRDGEIAAYVNTERFSRLKKHPGLRSEDLDELLGQAGLELSEIDHVLLCNLHLMDSPDIVKMHGSDLKETWIEFWTDQCNATVSIAGQRIPCTVNPDHHLIHAATAYYTSPFDSAAVLAIDPTGCRAFLGRDSELFELRRDYDRWFNANIGYCSVSELLFGSSLVGAGKVMGLAPFGRPAEPIDPEREPVDLEQLIALADRYRAPVRVAGQEMNAALAYFVQVGLERQLAAVFTDLAPIVARHGIEQVLCLSGGTALNAVATESAFAASDFERIHFHPACGDDGTAIGAALWYWHHVLGNPRREHTPAGQMYSIRTYDDTAVRRALDPVRDRLVVAEVSDPRLRADRVAELVAAGAVIGWFDGASEVGPRALGHRSIVADPRDPAMADRLNTRVKFRETFRPFAPSVHNHRATEWFGLRDSPYMLRTATVRRAAEVPAVTHVDGTSRIQTVTRADNPAYYDMIAAFEARTRIPMVLNTSLNTRGEPVVETPADAVRTLLTCDLDYLAFPSHIVGKRGAS